MNENMTIYMPGGELEAVLGLGILRYLVNNYKDPIMFHVIVDNIQSKEIVESSGLVTTTIIPLNKEERDYWTNKYLFHKICPTLEEGIKYGFLNKNRKEEKLKKFLGEDSENINVPDIMYGYIMTGIKNIQGFIRNEFDPFWEIDDEKLGEASPYAQTRKVHREKVKKLLRTEIKSIKYGNPIGQDYYVLVAVPEDVDNLNLWGSFHKNFDFFDCIYLNPDGSIWDSGVKLNTIEQIALVEHPSCLSVIGSNWLPQVAWGLGKPYIVHTTEEEDLWTGIRASNCLSFVLKNRKLEELLPIVEKLIQSNLGNKFIFK